MKCGCCGKEVGDFFYDKGYQMPDEIWDLSSDDREARTKIDDDLCRLDNRYFLRGVANLAVKGTNKEFGWGIWVEVPQEKFFEYIENYNSDNSAVASFSGTVANNLPFHPKTMGIAAEVQLGNETQRPTFKIVEPSHLLTQEQINGITLERVHEFNK